MPPAVPASLLRAAPATFRATRRVLPALALSVALGCGDSGTAPPPDEPFEIDLQLAQLYPAEIHEFAIGPVMECGADLRAVATGTGIATWQGATFYWFAGTDRTAPIDSVRVSSAEVRAGWQRDSISSARVEEAAWDFSGRAPFDLEAHFRYRLAGETTTRTAVIRFTCGPTLPAGGAPAPQLAVQTLDGSTEVEPGDTVRVTYTATSTFGLWITGIAVNDAFPFDITFSERLSPLAQHVVDIEVPRSGALGTPLSVEVFALDAALQVSTAHVDGDVRFVDRTPPVVTSVGPLAAQYAVGQQLPLVVHATDNNHLRWLVWEVGAPANLRDSIIATAPVPTFTYNVPLTVQASWVGASSFTVQLRDAAGLQSPIVVARPAGITFVAAP